MQTRVVHDRIRHQLGPYPLEHASRNLPLLPPFQRHCLLPSVPMVLQLRHRPRDASHDPEHWIRYLCLLRRLLRPELPMVTLPRARDEAEVAGGDGRGVWGSYGRGG